MRPRTRRDSCRRARVGTDTSFGLENHSLELISEGSNTRVNRGGTEEIVGIGQWDINKDGGQFGEFRCGDIEFKPSPRKGLAINGRF